MVALAFAKWEGTGNDFILIDDREGRSLPLVEPLVSQLCDRHFGVGSDGVILIRPSQGSEDAYHMEFMNPDGSRSFCGNGSRCAYAFWTVLTGSDAPVRFSAVDGAHLAQWVGGMPSIGMRDVDDVKRIHEDTDEVHTGSPHLIRWVDDPFAVDLMTEARSIRYGETYRERGINVNFARWTGDRVRMRTYERGVEAETLSCGTGVTAAAICAMERGWANAACTVETSGGTLRVVARKEGSLFRDIRLTGPARHVFSGSFPLAKR